MSTVERRRAAATFATSPRTAPPDPGSDSRLVDEDGHPIQHCSPLCASMGGSWFLPRHHAAGAPSSMTSADECAARCAATARSTTAAPATSTTAHRAPRRAPYPAPGGSSAARSRPAGSIPMPSALLLVSWEALGFRLDFEIAGRNKGTAGRGEGERREDGHPRRREHTLSACVGVGAARSS